MAKQKEGKSKTPKVEAPYCYYVAFQSIKEGQTQMSCSIVKRARPIDSEKEVGDLVAFLLQINKLQAVIPINWILLTPGLQQGYSCMNCRTGLAGTEDKCPKCGMALRNEPRTK